MSTVFYLKMLTLLILFMSNTDPVIPLEPCPDTPNCHIESTSFDLPSDILFQDIETVIREMGVIEIQSNAEIGTIHAVFRIPLFGFKDDVNITVEQDSTGRSTLHIRSASRVGYSDLGVNRRRVNRIFKKLNQKL